MQYIDNLLKHRRNHAGENWIYLKCYNILWSNTKEGGEWDVPQRSFSFYFSAAHSQLFLDNNNSILFDQTHFCLHVGCIRKFWITSRKIGTGFQYVQVQLRMVNSPCTSLTLSITILCCSRAAHIKTLLSSEVKYRYSAFGKKKSQSMKLNYRSCYRMIYVSYVRTQRST